MPRVRDLLYRFRPAGTPGGAGAVGMPVDHACDLAAELAPVFEQLAPTEAACAEIRKRAAHDAASIREGCQRRASEIVAAARAGMDAHRADAVARASQLSEARSAAAVAAAEPEAIETVGRAAANMAHYVDLVTASVLHRIGAHTSRDDAVVGNG